MFLLMTYIDWDEAFDLYTHNGSYREIQGAALFSPTPANPVVDFFDADGNRDDDSIGNGPLTYRQIIREAAKSSECDIILLESSLH